jgi:hypothetical protein
MAMKPSSKVIAKKAPAKSSGAKAAAPITRVTVSDKRGAERSVEVRKIDNGYIVRESIYDPKKGYTSKERFTEKAPTLDVTGPKAKK